MSNRSRIENQIKKQTKKHSEKNSVKGFTGSPYGRIPLWVIIAMLFGFTVLALILYCVIFPDNLMHSDTAAEVVLSRLLADENQIITKDWFYSTEIRIVYSQLIMAPLFKIFTNYTFVKYTSVFVFYGLLIWAYYMLAKRFELDRKWLFLSAALLFAPLSNEYLDMMFIGCFYTSQVICTYLVLSFFIKKGRTVKREAIKTVLLAAAGLILGLSGLRYLAALYLPLLLSVCMMGYEEKKISKNTISMFLQSGILCVAAGTGFLINKFYLAVNYSFDTTSSVAFVDLALVPDRFMTSLKLMLEFMGYREIGVVTGLGMVNVVKCLFLIGFIAIVVWLWKNRMEVLNQMERLFLYYFLFLFLINWYMLIFTDVLQQYRYWIPVYITGVILFGIFLQKYEKISSFRTILFTAGLAIVVFGSLYGELWQDTKYNDCQKRYGYLKFLEENDYDFGYATFWNAPVTEYLSNGTIQVGNLGGENGVAAPYEWLTPKDYYRYGYHTGKTFLLLARTEEAGMLKGDFTVMEDPECVYQDEYYAIYEGTGMYLFSKGYEPE